MKDRLSTKLRRAAQRLERGFCQDTFARDIGGGPVTPDSPSAVAWCVFGAQRAEGVVGAGATSSIQNIETVAWNDAPETIGPEMAFFLYWLALIQEEQERRRARPCPR